MAAIATSDFDVIMHDATGDMGIFHDWSAWSTMTCVTEEILFQANGIVSLDIHDYYGPLSIACMRRFKNSLNWQKLTNNQHWTELMLWEFHDVVDFGIIVGQHYTCKVSEKFINMFQAKLEWSWISRNGSLSEDYIRSHKDHLDWGYLTGFQDMSEAFVREFDDRIAWDRLDIHKYSESFHHDYDYKIFWGLAFMRSYLDIAFVQKYYHRADWNEVWSQIQSEEFIRTFHDKVDWNNIWQIADVSEQFIDEHMHLIDFDRYEGRDSWFWDIISHRSLSLDFIRKHSSNLNWYLVCEYSRLPEFLILEYAIKVDWSQVSRYQALNLEFINIHKSKLTMCANILDIIRRERAMQTIGLIDTIPWDLSTSIGEYL